MNIALPEAWDQLLKDYTSSAAYKDTLKKVELAYQESTVYPVQSEIFAAFEHCSHENLKVVILGQDPYHQAKQANGLSFSVNPGVKIPPSLRNIYTELFNDMGVLPKTNGDLSNWARQGVLLLNTYLSVEDSKPMSHSKFGWEQFTNFVIQKTNENCKNVVYILWGNFAQKKATLIDGEKHLIIKSVHPSPLSASRGFFGSKPFTKTNNYLISNNKDAIDWSL